MSKNVLIVGLTGMPGAGKSTLAKLLFKKGMPVVIMGDAVREAAKRANLEMTDANLGNLMIRLRKEKGSGAIAYLVLDRIRSIIVSSPNVNAIIVDGIRNIEEMKVLGSLGAVKLLAIHGSSLVRFKQLLAVDIHGSEQAHDCHSQGSRKVARQAAESRPTAGPGRRLFAGHRYFTFRLPAETSNSYFAGSA